MKISAIHFGVQLPVILFLMSLPGVAEVIAKRRVGLPDECAMIYGDIEKRVKTVGEPNYFFRNIPDTNIVTYATGVGNTAFDLDQLTVHWLPGVYDPVPLGKKVLSTPVWEKEQDAFLMRLTAIDPYLKDKMGKKRPSLKNQMTKIQLSTNLGGVYQSTGQLGSASEGNYRYRVLTDFDGATYQDLNVDLKDKDHPEISVISEPKAICQNVPELKLPMLSKDGRLLSGFDAKDGESKIWSFDEKGKCTEVTRIGFSASKADFSYDGRYVVFHVPSSNFSYEYFETPTQGDRMSAYIFDIKTKSLRALTPSNGSNYFYPVFQKNGKILLTEIDKNGDAYFVVMDPKRVLETMPKIEMESVAQKSEATTNCMGDDCQKPWQKDGKELVGKLYSQICSQFDETERNKSITVGRSLTAKQCVSLVKNYRQQILSMMAVKKAEIHKGDNSTGTINNTQKVTSSKASPEDEISLEEMLAVCQ